MCEGKMSNQQTFSVVIPVHNRQHLLGRALQSLQRQTYLDFEVVVIDDGSDDDPETVVAELRDNRIRILKQKNAGAAVARNNGARAASGTFITFLDSDDEARPEWLERLADGFLNRGADIVCCGLERVADGSKTKKDVVVSLPSSRGPMHGNVVGKFTNGGVYALRKSLFLEIGGFAEDLRSGQHTEMAMRLLPLAADRRLSIYNIMEPLVTIHIHKGPRIRYDPAALYAGATWTIERHLQLFQLDPKLHASYHAIAGVNALRMGASKEARGHFVRAVKINPAKAAHWQRLIGWYIRMVVK
jgi:glycosyltransferase involved in cell wall biosynthesis